MTWFRYLVKIQATSLFLRCWFMHQGVWNGLLHKLKTLFALQHACVRALNLSLATEQKWRCHNLVRLQRPHSAETISFWKIRKSHLIWKMLNMKMSTKQTMAFIFIKEYSLSLVEGIHYTKSCIHVVFWPVLFWKRSSATRANWNPGFVS